MAKSKRGGPALFELLQGNRFRRDETQVQHNLRVVNHEHDHSDEAEASNDDTGTLQVEKPALVHVREDRLHVSLTPLSAAAIVFGISVLILGVYLAGRSRGEKAGVMLGISQSADPAVAESVEDVRNQPPASHLVESLLEGNPRSTAPKPRESTRARNAEETGAAAAAAELPAGPRQGWARDYTYIVAQEFGAGRMDDARAAQQYLASRGFPAEIVKLDSGPLQLITLEGYNHKDAAQKKKADEVLKRQRAAGVEYFATGGGYKLEGYYKTLKKDQW